MNPEIDGEVVILCFAKDGELPQVALGLQARRVLQCAARVPRGSQDLWTTGPNGAVVERVKIKNGPGGCVIVSARDAGTKLGASLILAIEALGAGRKVRIDGEVAS